MEGVELAGYIVKIVAYSAQGVYYLFQLCKDAVKGWFDTSRSPPSAANQNYPKPDSEQHKKQLVDRGLKEDEYNVAVIGRVSVGKSSLINALAGLRGGDEGAAAIDSFEVEMSGVTKYMMKDSCLALWDVPGMGGLLNATQSASNPKDYVEANYLYAMDAVILVYTDSFMQADKDVFQALRDYINTCNDKTLRLILVKNKADQDTLSKFKIMAKDSTIPFNDRLHLGVEMEVGGDGQLRPTNREQEEKQRLVLEAMSEVKETSKSKDLAHACDVPWFYISAVTLSEVVATVLGANSCTTIAGDSSPSGSASLLFDEVAFLQQLTKMVKNARNG